MESGGLTTDDLVEGVTYALVVSLSAAALASWLSPSGTIRWKHSFCSIVLFAAVAVQFYYVGLVAVRVPAGTSVVLSECRRSGKGGKGTASFRDCIRGQAARCTRSEPCTPCDVPVGLTEFDNLLWPNDCNACSNTELGVCGSPDDNNVEWCTVAGSSSGSSGRGMNVEPCRTCCFRKPTLNTTADDCASVYSDFDWDASGLLQCNEAAFPEKTRFGCCPASAARAPPSVSASASANGNGNGNALADTISLGDGEVLPACAVLGPHGASWDHCRDETEPYDVNASVALLVPQGCRLFANGKPTGDAYCRPPSIHLQ